MANKLEVKITAGENIVSNFRMIQRVTSYEIQGDGEFMNGNYFMSQEKIKELIFNKAKKLYGEDVKIEYQER